MVFYFVTRYEDGLATFSSGGMLGGSAYPGLQEWEKNVLMTWAAQDPVSPAELTRNNASYVFQGNRNPFIDHPEWIQTIWGTQIIDNEVPSTPTNLAVASTSTASANLTWTASSDNIAVAFYKIYVDGNFYMNASTNSATVSRLSQGTTYTFYVIAADAAGNVSPQSNTATGTTLIDDQSPTAATNLTLGSVGTNNISISWTAATDNIGVVSYNIYVNGQLMGSTTDTNANIANLDPSTVYTLYVVAKDAAGNLSPVSNSVTATTQAIGLNCGDENFENIPKAASNYSTYNWTSNGISWTSEDSRTDETINGRAITIRDGSLTALSAPNGIGDLTVTTQRKFSGGSGTFKIFINDVDTGKTIPYSDVINTTTVTGLNVSGNVEISLVNTSSKDRVAIDDMKWTCYNGGLATNENAIAKASFTIYPNPVKNNELNVSGKDLTKIENAQIFDYSGKLVQTVSQPFKNSNKIMLNNLPKGVYILKADRNSTKFIVQ